MFRRKIKSSRSRRRKLHTEFADLIVEVVLWEL